MNNNQELVLEIRFTHFHTIQLEDVYWRPSGCQLWQCLGSVSTLIRKLWPGLYQIMQSSERWCPGINVMIV